MSLTPDELRLFHGIAEAFRVPPEQLEKVMLRYRELALAERRDDLLARLETGDTDPALLGRAFGVLSEQYFELADDVEKTLRPSQERA